MKIIWSFLWFSTFLNYVLSEPELTTVTPFIEEDDTPKNTLENNNHPSTFQPATFTTLNLDEHLSDTSSNETQQNDIISSKDFTSQNKFDVAIKEEHENEYLDELATENYETTTGTFPVSIKDIFQGKVPKEEDLKGINIIKNWLEEKKQDPHTGLFDSQNNGDEVEKNEFMSTTYSSTDKKNDVNFITTDDITEITTNSEYLTVEVENDVTVKDENNHSIPEVTTLIFDYNFSKTEAPLFPTINENNEDAFYNNEFYTGSNLLETSSSDEGLRSTIRDNNLETTTAKINELYNDLTTIDLVEYDDTLENTSENKFYTNEFTTLGNKLSYNTSKEIPKEDTFSKNDLPSLIENDNNLEITTTVKTEIIEIIEGSTVTYFPKFESTKESFNTKYDITTPSQENEFPSSANSVITTIIQDAFNVEQNFASNDKDAFETTTINNIKENKTSDYDYEILIAEKIETTTDKIITSSFGYDVINNTLSENSNEEIDFTNPENNTSSTSKSILSMEEDEDYENQETSTLYKFDTTNKQEILETFTIPNKNYTIITTLNPNTKLTTKEEQIVTDVTTSSTTLPVVQVNFSEESDHETNINIPEEPNVPNFPHFDENVEEEILHLFKDELSSIHQIKTDDFETKKSNMEQDNNILLNTQAEDESNFTETTTNAAPITNELTTTSSPNKITSNLISEHNKGNIFDTSKHTIINTDLSNDLRDSSEIKSEEYIEEENVENEDEEVEDKLQYLLESKSGWSGTTKQISEVDMREMKASSEEHVKYLQKDVKDVDGVNCLRINVTISINIYNNSLIEVPPNAYLIGNCSLEEQNLKITWRSEFDNFNNSIYLKSTFEDNESYITYIKIKVFQEKTGELIVQQKNDMKILKFNQGNETTKHNAVIPFQKNIFLTFEDSSIKDLLYQETGERASILERNTLLLQIASGSFCAVVILIVASIFAYKKIKSKTRIFKVSIEK